MNFPSSQLQVVPDIEAENGADSQAMVRKFLCVLERSKKTFKPTRLASLPCCSRKMDVLDLISTPVKSSNDSIIFLCLLQLFVSTEIYRFAVPMMDDHNRIIQDVGKQRRDLAIFR